MTYRERLRSVQDAHHVVGSTTAEYVVLTEPLSTVQLQNKEHTHILMALLVRNLG